MIAKIDKIGESQPDIDTGKTYKRFMANQNNIKKYLNYPDEAGNQMIEDALALANQKFDFKIIDSKKECFI